MSVTNINNKAKFVKEIKKARRGEHVSRRAFQSDLARLKLFPPPAQTKEPLFQNAEFI